MSHILYFPIDYHVKRPKKEQKICQKSKIGNFTILYTTLVDILHMSMHEFWGQICCVLSDKMSFEDFSPIWSHVNENEKKKK